MPLLVLNNLLVKEVLYDSTIRCQDITGFFLKRLINQKNVSPQTVSTYRDTFRLLLTFLQEQTHKTPSHLTLEDLDAPMILRFLDYLEIERGNSIRSRNARLSAIRSFFHYASYLEPASMAIIQRGLAIPLKRSDRPLVEFLSVEEVEALITAPDCSTWSGKRDHTMFTTLYNTGARVSEIIALRISDVCLDKNAYVRIYGKGRKERVMPLWTRTSRLIKDWLNSLNGNPTGPLFPNTQGKALTRYGVEYRLRMAKDQAINKCPSLKNKRVSPHVLRHTTAMHLLQSGIDINVIALWLGHESPSTTHIYLEADLAMKESVLQKLEPPRTNNIRFRPTDPLLKFLESL
ncbi:MAG: site-specific integrase [Candidatus Brocadiales bacterium]|nr:site-specific integrase [Candidatus Brocadiales bacterium]